MQRKTIGESQRLTSDYTYTFSALADMLKEQFSLYKNDEFPSPGMYYYTEIKSYHFQDRCINVKKSTLDVLEGKVNDLSLKGIQMLIIKALKIFAHANMPVSDADWFTKEMKFKIVN
jgi:hypothetical protein